MKKIFTKSKIVCSDTITPIGTFLNLRDRFPGVSLFESSDYRNRQNSKSFICADPIAKLTVDQKILKLRIEHELVLERQIESGQSVSDVIDSFDFSNDQVSELNGFFGLIGYDAIPLFEDIELNEGDLPSIFLAIYRYVIVFDNFTNQATLLFNSYEGDEADPFDLEVELFKAKKHFIKFGLIGAEDSNETDDSFAGKVNQVKGFIARGDVFQLVLSRKFYQRFEGDEFEVYRQLRMLNPSPYMFFFDMDRATVLGASPEAQFKVKGGKAEIHPIAGTVKRTGDVKVDEALVLQLAQDAKENAEHTMLVDLARNDLNRSCTDVGVQTLKEIQQFSHVIHMVSRIEGLIYKHPIEAFGDAFPAGTLSGAPKYRAMELINQLENTPRGFYGGAIGQIAANGDLNMAIVIRSCLCRNQKIEYQAGAGVVMDSTPQGETQEVHSKVNVIRTAIELANQQK